MNELAAFRDGNLNISLRKDGDYVVGLEFNVFLGVAGNRFSKIEGKHVRRQIVWVHSLDGRIFPVVLRGEPLHVILQFGPTELKTSSLGIDGKLILAIPIVVRYQESAVGNKIVHPHAA